MTKPKADDKAPITEHFERTNQKRPGGKPHDVPWSVSKKKRGDLDLDGDDAQHRRFQSLYDDLQN